MNSFYEHHKDSIHWHYRCFDRILLNGLIQPFQQPERVVGFFNTYRQLSFIEGSNTRWCYEPAGHRGRPQHPRHSDGPRTGQMVGGPGGVRPGAPRDGVNDT
jgi:hypothetical protein